MTAYSITGTLIPDATTENTGEPAGTYNGQDYWSWTNGETTWYLYYFLNKGVHYWRISQTLGQNTGLEFWQKMGVLDVPGTYAHSFLYAGEVTVAEYVTPTYPIRNISQVNTVIENGSAVVKCSGRGGINSIIKSISRNPTELVIGEIQDKYDSRFDDPNYYWNRETG